MITKWRVFNFKSIRKETALNFAPLTIFAGANSSGKSTFLQSILLVAQTLAHKVTSRSVVLNGAFARLGQFDDLRSVDSDADQIVIGWTVRPLRDFQSPFYDGRSRDALSSVSCEVAFDTEGSGAQKEISQTQPRLSSSQLSTTTRDPEEGDQVFSIIIRQTAVMHDGAKQKWINASDNETSRTSLQYDVALDENSLADIREEWGSAELVGCQPRHFLPGRLFLGVDMVVEDAQTILDIITRENPRGIILRRHYEDREIAVPATIVDFILNLAGDASKGARRILSERLQHSPDLFGFDGVSLEKLIRALVLSEINPGTRREIRQRLVESEELEQLVIDSMREHRKEEHAIRPSPPPRAIARAITYLDNFFSTAIRYLGPLRDEPKSLYPLSPASDPSDVGLKGEHTAAVLELYKNRPVRYIPTSAFSDAENNPQPITRALETAVVDWLQYLGVAEDVKSEDRGKFGHELTVRIAGTKRPHDLTHFGVGVSQVLPILIASLLSEPDTTLVFEQPELHLHPKVQTRLADFFLSITRLGKQCVLETHSEYLINRLRFRVAAAVEPNPWVEAVKMYFVECPPEGSTFQEVKINEYGAVVDWPDGFFDQSQQEAEAILMAAVKKRKNKRRR
ncbi:MAG: DUF3696 domain-containing protein [Desulfurellaceae bacterium]|nr:DUF3696 domain-containing protein [Desulfurellaceae bacterium]